MMKFFTPELYLRYNSPDDSIADLADEEWERAIRGYKDHLVKYSSDMNDRVRELAENLCLHDAELLSIQEDVPNPLVPHLFPPFRVAIISLRSGERITNLIYFLWSEIEQSRPEVDWPFSKLRTHWLYDELDVERHPSSYPKCRHTILWSDGRVLSIPFLDVVVQSFSQQNPEAALIIKKRA
jgi:hypothetical protein